MTKELISLDKYNPSVTFGVCIVLINPVSGLVESTNKTTKIQVAKISEAVNLPWPKARVLLNLTSPFGKHSLSPYEIVTRCSVHVGEGAYGPTL